MKGRTLPDLDERVVRALRLSLTGPETVFVGGALLAIAGWCVSQTLIPALAMGVTSTLLLGLGGVMTAVFWRGRSISAGHVTYFDAGGALLLLGCCAAALTEPDALIQVLSQSEQN